MEVKTRPLEQQEDLAAAAAVMEGLPETEPLVKETQAAQVQPELLGGLPEAAEAQVRQERKDKQTTLSTVGSEVREVPEQVLRFLDLP